MEPLAFSILTRQGFRTEKRGAEGTDCRRAGGRSVGGPAIERAADAPAPAAATWIEVSLP